MKVWFLIVCALGMIGPVTAQIPQDVAFPESGGPVVGRVREVETLFLVVKTESEKEPVRIPLDEIAWVDFGEAQLMTDFLRRAAFSPVTELTRFWEERRSLLEVPGSTGGVIGLRLAQRFLSQGTLMATSSALEVADLIMKKDWNSETKEEARILRAAALLGLRRGLEATAELDELGAMSLNERLRGMAALMRGDLAMQGGQRRAALEQYLKPYVFGGLGVELPQVGLKRARQVAAELPYPEKRFRAIDQQLEFLRTDRKEVK